MKKINKKKIFKILLFLVIPLTMLECRDDPIPNGIPTGAVVVKLQMHFDGTVKFDKFNLTVDQVQVVHRTDINDPATEKIYEVNKEKTSFNFFNDDNVYFIGQYEVPEGVVMEVRYRVVSAVLTVNGVDNFMDFQTPSAGTSGLKFIPEVTPSPFVVTSGGMFAVEGIFYPKDRIVVNKQKYLLRPTIPSRYVPISTQNGVLTNELTVMAKPGTPFSTVKATTDAYQSQIISPYYYDTYRIRLAPSTQIVDAYNFYSAQPWVKVVARSEVLALSAINPVGEIVSTPQNTAQLPNGWQRAFNKLGKVGDQRPIIAIIDSGVDLRNRDIVDNLFINPGEIAHLGITDVNGDGYIEISDIADPVNAAFNPGDLNGNGYLDGQDILASPIYADGIDQDGNGFTDDLFGWDFVDNDNNPYGGHWHGTAVAGVTAGANNGGGILGTTHNARIMAVRVLDNNGRGSTAQVLGGMMYVARTGQDAIVGNDVDIANMSLGSTWVYVGSGVPCSNCAGVDKNSWDTSVQQQLSLYSFLSSSPANLLWVVAAGNEGADLNSPYIFGSICETVKSLVPTRSFIVGSVDNSGLNVKSWFSNYGNAVVDMTAPGESWTGATIGSGWPTISPIDGTSFSTPAVSGALGLLISMDPVNLQGNAAQLRSVFFAAAPMGANSSLFNGGKFMNLDQILASLGYP